MCKQNTRHIIGPHNINIILRDNELCGNRDYVYIVIMMASQHQVQLQASCPDRIKENYSPQTFWRLFFFLKYIPIPPNRMEEYCLLVESALLHTWCCSFGNFTEAWGEYVPVVKAWVLVRQTQAEAWHGHLLPMWPRSFLSSTFLIYSVRTMIVPTS